ncbi:FAD-dependent oxidoreductase [Faecalibacterium gallinarum]|uniref:Urocanate reductase n=1 Tax=Faecalibacterium gallinarum TaxID=2903556 RepID=A0AA37N3C3_9FIRM|nr:FAD-dependent oxidoreductase [Faecalibacterium gallinarum]GJN65565.1 FAD-binding dehydrogenase [Faecalibacterium gallinarum]
MKKISRKGFLRVAAMTARSATTAAALAACQNSGEAAASSAASGNAGIYTPGTYTATETGMGTVTVTMTFSDSAITEVKVDTSKETIDVAVNSAEEFQEALMAAQSAEIDGVSGASITSKAVKKAAASCIEQAMGLAVEEEETVAVDDGTPAWLGHEPEIADSEIVETLDTEVLVVGGGTGGLFAACSAGENGAKTLVIDKLTSGGVRDDLGAIDSRYQKEWGTKIDKFDYITEMTKTAAGRLDQRLVKLWAEESGEAIDWYGDRLAERGVELWHEAGGDDEGSRYIHFATGHSPKWEGSDDGEGNQLNGAKVLTDYALTLGVEFRYNTPMVKLIKENGRVTGAIAENEDGGYVRINASKGVIVATGGYSLNYDMLEALQPENLAIVGLNGSIPGATGDGIKACIWAGGKFDETHSMMMFDRAALKPDAVPGRAQIESGETSMFWMGSQPFLKVNSKGERFFNESGTYEGILHADEFNKDHCHYTIFDSDWTTYIQSFKTHGCSRMFPFPNGAEPNRTYQSMEESFPGMIEKGVLFQCDTIAELAEKLGLPADALEATVERYNELYDKGVDEDFGKESFRLSAVRKAPFYGVKNTGFILCTMDGIQIDQNMNAVDTNNEPIPGLYVVGNDSGAYFSATYPNLSTGAACGRTVTFGRRAGRIAATCGI